MQLDGAMLPLNDCSSDSQLPLLPCMSSVCVQHILQFSVSFSLLHLKLHMAFAVFHDG
jgi:hypothetical protein